MSKRHQDLKIIVPQEGPLTRIDAWIASHDDRFPRSAASDTHTEFFINGNPVKKSRVVKHGDHLEVRWIEQLFDQVEGQPIDLDIVYEDAQLLVIDKQQHLVVHPGAGNHDGTLVHALVHRYGDRFFLSDDDDEESDSPDALIRPGIVHRLDKDTSGIMVIAKDRQTHQHLCDQFRERTTSKFYVALVEGVLEKRRGHLETTIVRDRKDRRRFSVGAPDQGKDARTDYLVLRQFSSCALVRLRLHTGRTHQIRVHMASIGHPVVGDPIYGRRRSAFTDATLMLHALSLELTHPVTDHRVRFRAPLPQRFSRFIRSLSIR